jgi:nucleoside-diphosphate-sugar epimerase
VGNERVTIRSIAEMIAGMDKQYTAGIRFETAVKPETQQQFDNSHTCQALDWQPQIPLREGLKDMLKGMKHG